MATATCPGFFSGYQKTVLPHSGQKWSLTGRPLPPILVKIDEAPVTTVAL